MAWTICQFRKGEIDRAGQQLITLPVWDPERDIALEVINNWRSCHNYPLHIVTKTLGSRAKTKISEKSLVARRIKRMASIAIKLRQNPGMKLSQMQDIGGCRAILNNVNEVENLVEVYEQAAIRHPRTDDRPFILKKYDYIEHPKDDGYRGVHLILKYASTAPAQHPFNGQRVEIQIRSRLQHAWATAVETCQAFTGQALKSKIKDATEQWLRFFSLMSAAIADREKRPSVPGTHTSRAMRKKELKQLVDDEQIIFQLNGWSAAMQHPTVMDDHESAVYLLELDTAMKTLQINPYKQSEMAIANHQYLLREKATESDSNIQIVLVSADSVSNLKRAYPNFYVDTKVFISAVQQEIY